VDERVRSLVDLELSIGDYILSGGEIPALVVIDAILRLLPGAIDAASTTEESFAEGLLEYPQYTRPPEFAGLRVPEVLVSGHHGEVARWRREQAVVPTRAAARRGKRRGRLSAGSPVLYCRVGSRSPHPPATHPINGPPVSSAL
jgi:tRNA (guanine-N1)-methyltransferase